jgi:tetratricopeptide (TPR) repeat protein
LSNISLVLKDLGQFKEAKKGFLKAIKIYKKQFGEDHIEYGKTLNNLSSVHGDLGEN